MNPSEQARIADLARRATARALGYAATRRRPRCKRCGGWLYVEIVTTTDAYNEVACLNCGARGYMKREDLHDGDADDDADDDTAQQQGRQRAPHHNAPRGTHAPAPRTRKSRTDTSL